MLAWQINEDSLFNADECELYAKIWSEFDEDLCGRISIENLRPLIERLCDSGARECKCVCICVSLSISLSLSLFVCGCVFVCLCVRVCLYV